MRELILYVATECKKDGSFGAVMLNKILFWSDFLTFAYHGKAITGVEYQKLKNGPAPRRLLSVRDQMKSRGEIELIEIPLGRMVQHRVLALREPKLDLFSKKDLLIVDEVIRAHCGKAAKKVSAMSHGIAWESVDLKESIPYDFAVISDAPVTIADKQWARRMLARGE